MTIDDFWFEFDYKGMCVAVKLTADFTSEWVMCDIDFSDNKNRPLLKKHLMENYYDEILDIALLGCENYEAFCLHELRGNYEYEKEIERHYTGM